MPSENTTDSAARGPVPVLFRSQRPAPSQRAFLCACRVLHGRRALSESAAPRCALESIDCCELQRGRLARSDLSPPLRLDSECNSRRPMDPATAQLHPANSTTKAEEDEVHASLLQRCDFKDRDRRCRTQAVESLSANDAALLDAVTTAAPEP